jgi:hypothetical protein
MFSPTMDAGERLCFRVGQMLNHLWAFATHDPVSIVRRLRLIGYSLPAMVFSPHGHYS